MKVMDNKNYEMIKNGLEAAVKRSRVISNNIANANTKGYKKFKVTFEESIHNGNDGLKRTSAKHFDKSGGSGAVKVVRDNSGSMRSDGNNVDVDSEMTNLAANTLKYNAMVSEVNKMFRMNRMVIKGGE